MLEHRSPTKLSSSGPLRGAVYGPQYCCKYTNAVLYFTLNPYPFECHLFTLGSLAYNPSCTDDTVSFFGIPSFKGFPCDFLNLQLLSLHFPSSSSSFVCTLCSVLCTRISSHAPLFTFNSGLPNTALALYHFISQPLVYCSGCYDSTLCSGASIICCANTRCVFSLSESHFSRVAPLTHQSDLPKPGSTFQSFVDKERKVVADLKRSRFSSP